MFPKKSWEQLAQQGSEEYLILITAVNNASFMYVHVVFPHQKVEKTNYEYSDKSNDKWNVHHFTVRLVTTEPTALVFAPPAVKVTTPAEVIVPARVPATPPDIVKTSP